MIGQGSDSSESRRTTEGDKQEPRDSADQPGLEYARILAETLRQTGEKNGYLLVITTNHVTVHVRVRDVILGISSVAILLELLKDSSPVGTFLKDLGLQFLTYLSYQPSIFQG